MIQVFTAILMSMIWCPMQVLTSCCRALPSVWGDAAGVCQAGRATTLLLPGFAWSFPYKCCYALLAPKTSSLRKVKLYVRRLKRSKTSYLYISIFNM